MCAEEIIEVVVQRVKAELSKSKKVGVQDRVRNNKMQFSTKGGRFWCSRFHRPETWAECE